MNVKLKNLFLQKRNLVVTILVCVFLLAILGGIIYASIAYGNGKMGKALYHRKVWYAVLCVLMMAAVFLAQLLFRVRFSVFCEIALISFAFAALAGGTVFTLYSHIPVWDKILHTLSGPLFSIVGLGFAILLSEKQPTEKRRVVMCVVFSPRLPSATYGKFSNTPLTPLYRDITTNVGWKVLSNRFPTEHISCPTNAALR